MENNQPKKKNAGLMALIVVLLIITTIASCVGMYAWARYTSSQNGSSTAQVAKWYFNLKTGKATIGAETKTLLNLTRTDGYGHVVEGEIAPGTHGELPIIVDTTGTEVDLQYTVEVVIENCPTNMTFSSASGSTVTETRSGTGATAQDPKIATITITKYVSCNPENLNGEHNETLTWNWPYETFDTNNSAVAGDAADKADNGKTITVRVKATGTEMFEPPSTGASITTAALGQYVNLGTNLLDLGNITLSDDSNPAADWRVFSKDANGAWLILADYLPVGEGTVGASVVGSIGLETDDKSYEYLVWSNDSREDLMDKLNGNWSSLITGSNVAGTPSVQVKGAVDLPTWVSSWNASYASDTLHTSYETGINGWYIGESENPSDYYVDLSSKNGYNNTSLYFPHHESLDNDTCYGYWLASPAAGYDSYVMDVTYDGYVYRNSYDNGNCGVRPAVYLPSNISFNTSGEVWTIAQ